MRVKYKKPKYWYIVLIPFGVLLMFGLFSLLACHGECDASDHGGVLDYVHNKLYIPWEVTIPSIVFGAIGSIIGLMLLLYYLVIVYEAEFDSNGITVQKGKKDIFIDFYKIKELDYRKPTFFNYLTAPTDRRNYPGRLLVIMKKEGKRQEDYIIRLKYKDYKKLPKKYVDFIGIII